MVVRGLIIIAVSMSFFFFNLKTLESEGEGAMAIRVIVLIGNLVGIAFVYFGGRAAKEEQDKKAKSEDQKNEKNTPIAVTPSQQRELRLSLIDGEYRFFQNYHINGQQYTYGFPKSNCSDKRIWVGKGTVEIERISQAEAQRRIGNINLRIED